MNLRAQLCEFVLKHKPLTRAQHVSPWRYLYRGNVRTGEGLVVTGVIVPADGEQPGYRVMVEDMNADDSPQMEFPT